MNLIFGGICNEQFDLKLLNSQITTLDMRLSSHTHLSLAKFSKNFTDNAIDLKKLNTNKQIKCLKI